MIRLPKQPPFWLVAIIVIAFSLSLLPLALAYKVRQDTNRKQPRIHLFQGMDNQPRLNTQAYSAVFADGRAMRPPVPGTVAVGELREDDHYERGYQLVDRGGVSQPVFYDSLPKALTDKRSLEDLMDRGQVKFNTFCYPCHGMDGMGNGPVAVRARLVSPAWTPPSNILQVQPDGKLTYGEELYPDGKLYNTITHGIRNMAGYGPQIEVDDRWAIVLYIRAMQKTQSAPGS